MAELDVVVIGAGISGLTVAKRVQAAGRSVRVLEGRHRVGGRLHAVGGLDLGATWFWPGERRVARLIDEVGLDVFSQHLVGDAVYHAPAGTRRLDGNPIDVQSGRFTRGADSLACAVARTLAVGTVQLATTVTDVRRRTDGMIEAESAGRAVAVAHDAVIAVPPALAVASIDFSPALGERLAAIASSTPVWMGSMTKVVVRYSAAFWRRAGLSGAGISHVGPLREVHDMCGPDGTPAALFGFATPLAVGASTVSADAVVAQLIEMFGDEAGSPEEVVIVDWRHEPLTSPPTVERLTDYETYGSDVFGPAADPRADSWGGRLHWSSTETSTTHPGHIEGALEAAERVVRAILHRSDHADRPFEEHRP